MAIRFTAILNQFESSAVVPDIWATTLVFILKPPPEVGRMRIGLMALWPRASGRCEHAGSAWTPPSSGAILGTRLRT
eukprot:4170196-Pyramimonas_sp.AAC.1